MHLSLSTNFSFRRFDLVLGPSLHHLPPQQPHLLHDPLLDRIGLLEVSLAVLYRPNYRRKMIAKTRVRLETGQNRLVRSCSGRHLLNSHPFPNPNLTPHHFQSHPLAGKSKRFALHASLQCDRRSTAGGAYVGMTPRSLGPVRSKSRKSGRCRAFISDYLPLVVFVILATLVTGGPAGRSFPRRLQGARRRKAVALRMRVRSVRRSAHAV